MTYRFGLIKEIYTSLILKKNLPPVSAYKNTTNLKYKCIKLKIMVSFFYTSKMLLNPNFLFESASE